MFSGNHRFLHSVVSKITSPLHVQFMNDQQLMIKCTRTITVNSQNNNTNRKYLNA